MTTATPPTDAMVARVRGYVDDRAKTTWTDDEDIRAVIARFPKTDRWGGEPELINTIPTNGPPTMMANPNWEPTYDLNAAAAELWDERANALWCVYNSNADGQTIEREKLYEHAKERAMFYRSRRGIRTIERKPWSGRERLPGYQINLPERLL